LTHAFQLIFNCTPAQFATATATTLPAVGATVIQNPIPAQGLIISEPFTFTATTAIGTALTAISSIVGLYSGLPVSAANFTPGTLTLGAVGAVNTATLAGGAATSIATETITATPGLGQIDFSYDGQYFLRFFGANPAPISQQSNAGVTENQMTTNLVAFLTSTFAATLGVPVPSNIAVPPPFVP